MTASLREAAQQALDALMLTHCSALHEQDCDVCNAIAALRAALALPDAEPVAHSQYGGPELQALILAKLTAPLERQPLTDAWIDDATCRAGILDCLRDPYDMEETGDEYGSVEYDIRRIARLVEAAHNIKGAA